MAQRPFLFCIMNPQNSQQALQTLQQAQSSALNPDAFLQQQENALGVSNQRDTVQGLRGALNNTTKLLQQVAPSVMGRTQGSLVTNAQATRQISNEQAPIAQNLNNQNQAYRQAAQDLSDLQARAQQAAQLQYAGQQDRLSYLQNLYNNYYQREQDEANRQEQIRQFNENLAAQRAAASANSLNFGGSSGGSAASAPRGAASIQRSSNGGYNFFDAAGRPVTAASYASVTGTGFRKLLSDMAANGDANAKVALQYVGNDGRFSNAPQSVAGALNAVGAKGTFQPGQTYSTQTINGQRVKVPNF